MIRRARWLDPRIEPDPPIVDSVNIPIDELANRAFELPPKNETIWIPDLGDQAEAAVRRLIQVGRIAKTAPNFEYGTREPGRLWSPNAFLEEVLSQVPPGTACDFGCGSGREAVYLADAGFDVTGIDRLADALDQAAALERRYHPAGPPIDWQVADLNVLSPSRKFDLVTCFYYLNRPLFRQLASWLNPGGHLVIETFTVAHRAAFGKPKSDDLVLQPGELETLIPSVAVIRVEEGRHGERHTARFWARFEE